MTDTRPRVVFHIDETGGVQVYQDEGVDVFCVSELAPNDRVYRYSPDPIPDEMLDGEVGHYADGSAAHARVTRAVKEAYGIPLLEEVK